MHSTRRQIAAGLILATVAGLGAGCANGTGTPPVTVLPTGASTVVLSGQPVVLDEHANRKVVDVQVGTTVELLLHSSYWNVNGSSDPAVLAPQGTATPLPVTPTCPPGVGCNPVLAKFAARNPGTSVLSASRTTCGEAMRCGPGNGSYEVTVVVTR